MQQRSNQSFHFIINVMLLLDSILLLLIIGTLHIVKIKYPNFLFFCKGAILFLPPDQQKPQTQKKSKKDKQQPQVKIMQIEYRHVKDYPMSDQYDRVIFLITSLIIFVLIKWLLLHIVDFISGKPNTIASSSFIFIISLVALIYTIKLGLQIFWISSYNLKYCFLLGIGLNVLFFMFYLSTSGLGNFDNELEWAITDYRKQLSIVVGKFLQQDGLNMKNTLAFVLFINILFTLVSIPAVIKFGNWYTKTLKQVYYQDQETSQITNPQEKKQREQKQALLKKKCGKTIRFLNVYLVCVLLFLFFSHRYIYNFLHQTIITLIRILLMGLMTFINCYTLKNAIQFNGSFAYKFIGEYLNSDNAQEKLKLRQKIIPYIYLIWYHKFQFMFRIIIPVLLFLMLIDWKYMHQDDKPLMHPPTISLTHCGIHTNKLSALENLYKCDFHTPTTMIHKVSESFANGILIAGKKDEDLSVTQERLSKYGLLNPHFMTQFTEQLLWYANITVYAMTVIYILFLRKTVYQI